MSSPEQNYFSLFAMRYPVLINFTAIWDLPKSWNSWIHAPPVLPSPTVQCCCFEDIIIDCPPCTYLKPHSGNVKKHVLVHRNVKRIVKHPVPLLICTYLILEKLSSKNQVWRAGFLLYFKLDFCRLHRQQKLISK